MELITDEKLIARITKIARRVQRKYKTWLVFPVGSAYRSAELIEYKGMFVLAFYCLDSKNRLYVDMERIYAVDKVEAVELIVDSKP